MKSRETLDAVAEEVKELTQFISDIDQEKLDMIIHPLLVNTLKATLYLLLYNAVESIANQVAIDIHDAISESGCSFEELSDTYQEHLLTCVAQGISAAPAGLTRLRGALAGLSVSTDLVMPKPSGGNLGAEVLTRYLRSLGVLPSGREYHSDVTKDALDQLRRTRNQLAHGETSFNEAGKRRAATDLQDLAQIIVKALEEVVKSSEEFIAARKFSSVSTGAGVLGGSDG